MTCSPSEWDLLQQQAFSRLASELSEGSLVCATAPTGFGKTKLSIMLCQWAERYRKPWVFYTHRKMLFSQTLDRFRQAGLSPGCRAAGYDTALLRDGQIAMLPTESRSIGNSREAHRAKLVIVDEAHSNKHGFADKILRHHAAEGAKIVGLTATPVNLGHLYSKLVVLAKNSDLRKAGGIVLADTYAPDEVDLSDVRKVHGEYPRKVMGKRFAIQQVVGSIYYHWKTLNKNNEPTLLFAPGVKESMWFVDRLLSKGVSAAHIDGENVYVGEKDKYGDNVVHRSSPELRDHIMQGSRSGHVQVICNRYVFREGVDAPWLGHLVLATTFGTEDGYVQAGGRVLRAFSGQDRVVVQDHGGNYWRHGSLNEDRVWNLSDTSISRERERREAVEKGAEQLPVTCPKCKKVSPRDAWAMSKCCPRCGHQFSTVVREVIQTDGQLKKIKGDAITRKLTYAAGQKMWDPLFYQSKNSKSKRASTFKQLTARFHKSQERYRVRAKGGETVLYDRQTGEYTRLGNVPPPKSIYWSREVKHVPRSELQHAPRF